MIVKQETVNLLHDIRKKLEDIWFSIFVPGITLKPKEELRREMREVVSGLKKLEMVI